MKCYSKGIDKGTHWTLFNSTGYIEDDPLSADLSLNNLITQNHI